MKKKYNLFISLGANCASTTYLRKHHLQFKSFPFDWLIGCPFEKRISLIINHFEDFLNLEDLEFVEKDGNPNDDKNCDYYKNIRTEFGHLHDFPIGIPLKESFQKVKEKYNRRIERFYEQINNSKDICLVWFNYFTQPKSLSESELIDGYIKLSQFFPQHHISFLVIEHSELQGDKLDGEKIHPNIIRYRDNLLSNDNSSAIRRVMGDISKSDKIFNQYKIIIPIYKRFFRIYSSAGHFRIYLFGMKVFSSRIKSK